MTVEDKAAAIIAKVGLWWPLAEEDQLRRAAEAYEQVAKAVLAAGQIGSAGAGLVVGDNRGDAVAAFASHWGRYDGSPAAGLPATAQAASDVAAALSRFAAEVQAAKRKIINLAIEIGATLAVGIGLALFSFGTSAGLAAARTAMLVARGLTVALGLSGIASTIVATMLVGAAFGAVEGFIGSIVAQVGKIMLSDGTGVSLGETMTWTGGGAVGGAVFAGAGLAVRGGYRALRHGDNIVTNRLRTVRWGDETGSIGGSGGRAPRPPERAGTLTDTSAGKKVNLTEADDAVGARARNVYGVIDPETGLPVTDVIIHGSKSGFAARTKGDPITPGELARMIRGHPDYDGGPIRLLGCKTGADGATAAQEVADELGVRVIAPSDKTWIGNDRLVVVGDDQYGPYQNLGHWNIFYPAPK